MKKGTNGKMVGQQNALKLKAWFDGNNEIPIRGGKPNKVAIARRAGLRDRQPLYNNKECAKLLANALERKNQTLSTGPDVTLHREKRAGEAIPGISSQI